MINIILHTLVSIFLQLIGLVVVAVALPFRKEDTSGDNDGAPRTFTQYPTYGVWQRIRLPRWALWWDNAYDGLLGDKRGEWAKLCNGKHSSLWWMYWWAAVRNPVNYYSRKVDGVDVSACSIHLLNGVPVPDETGASGDSWHHLVAVDSNGNTKHRYFGFKTLVGKWGISFNLGWKIKLEHIGTPTSAREQDRFKGSTFRFKFIKTS